MTAPIGRPLQPISNVMWVERERLHANAWNPNHVAPPELKLLRTSILEDGWTQPIVAGPHDTIADHFEVVDGYHRWLTSDDPDVWKLTEGYVPIVPIDKDEAERRLSTVRHNRARGTHHVVKMADIVATLVESGMDTDEVRRRLGMDAEEVKRLLQRGNMLERGSSPEGFGQAWRPAPKTRAT